jgi:hypothetical protein
LVVAVGQQVHPVVVVGQVVVESQSVAGPPLGSARVVDSSLEGPGWVLGPQSVEVLQPSVVERRPSLGWAEVQP